MKTSTDEAQFEIIRFTPSEARYYPKSVELGILAGTKGYIDHTRMEIDMGASRVGGPLIDFPQGERLPKNLQFAALLELGEFSRHDPMNLLPKSGFLYFFIGGYGDKGKVLYFDVKRDGLERVTREHDKWLWDGCLVKDIFRDTESFDSRYFEDPDEGIVWDYFAGSEYSKIYGIYTHCQKDESEIRKITGSSAVLLLQLGEDFTEEGVWSVLIKRSDLIRCRFGRCEFEWGQS